MKLYWDSIKYDNFNLLWEDYERVNEFIYCPICCPYYSIYVFLEILKKSYLRIFKHIGCHGNEIILGKITIVNAVLIGGQKK